MSADLAFLGALIQGLDTDSLEWLQIMISRILAGRKPEITARRAIIQKRNR